MVAGVGNSLGIRSLTNKFKEDIRSRGINGSKIPLKILNRLTPKVDPITPPNKRKNPILKTSFMLFLGNNTIKKFESKMHLLT